MNEEIKLELWFKGRTAYVEAFLTEDEAPPSEKKELIFFVDMSEIKREETDENGRVLFAYEITEKNFNHLFSFKVKLKDALLIEAKVEGGIDKNGRVFYEEVQQKTKGKKGKKHFGTGFGATLSEENESCIDMELSLDDKDIKEEAGMMTCNMQIKIKNKNEFREELLPETKATLYVTVREKKKKEYLSQQSIEIDTESDDFALLFYDFIFKSPDPGDIIFKVFYRESSDSKPIGESNAVAKKIEGASSKAIFKVDVSEFGFEQTHTLCISCFNEKNTPTETKVRISSKKEQKELLAKKGVLVYDVELEKSEFKRDITISVPTCINPNDSVRVITCVNSDLIKGKYPKNENKKRGMTCLV